MKKDDEILDEFGKKVSEMAFDSPFGSVKEVLSSEGRKFKRLKPYIKLFDRFNLEEKKIIEKYFYNIIGGSIFGFLCLFEENEQFKIVYEENGLQVDLVEISEMLKAEYMGEDGWIHRFSEVLDEDDDVYLI